MDESKDAVIAQVLEEVVRRRSAGEVISDDDISSSHPELLPELRKRLDALRIIEDAEGRVGAYNDFVSQSLTSSVGGDLAGTFRDSDFDLDGPGATSAAHFPTIEGYRIHGVLGQGGMGIVYRATQIKLNRSVALKLLPAMVGKASPSAVSRFRREASSAARLHHTNIVPVFDFGESRDGYYYAMELVTGRPLDLLIRRLRESDANVASPHELGERLERLVPSLVSGRRSIASAESKQVLSRSRTQSRFGHARYYDNVARWMADAADALAYAHQHGIIHRDVKPSNLIISADGRIMVADFGLAKTADDQSITVTGAMIGTVTYLSPEQATASSDTPIDQRSDVYSLGATMYEMLCFRPPFVGSDERQVITGILNRDPTPPRKLVPHVPAELETVCLKALEKDPEDRYPTAAAMADDLRRFLTDVPLSAKRPSVLVQVKKFVRRHRAATLAGALVLLLLVAGGILMRQRTALKRERNTVAEAELHDYLRSGIQKLDNRKWDAAARDFRIVVRNDPNHAEALTNLAIVNKEKFNAGPNAPQSLLSDGLALCDRAIAVDGTLLEAWNTKGVFLKKLGRFDEAVSAYQKAVQLDPDNVAPWFNLGVAQALAHRFDDAAASFDKATSLTKDEDEYCSVVWRNRATVDLLAHRRSAVEAASRAISCDRTDPLNYAVSSRVHSLPGDSFDPSLAHDHANFAIELSVDPAPASYRIRALTALRITKFSDAAADAAKAIELGDDVSPNQLVIALARAHQGEINAAKAALSESEKNWPQDLSEPSSLRLRAPKGEFWFESAAEWHALRSEVQRVIGGATESDQS